MSISSVKSKFKLHVVLGEYFSTAPSEIEAILKHNPEDLRRFEIPHPPDNRTIIAIGKAPLGIPKKIAILSILLRCQNTDITITTLKNLINATDKKRRKEKGELFLRKTADISSLGLTDAPDPVSTVNKKELREIRKGPRRSTRKKKARPRNGEAVHTRTRMVKVTRVVKVSDVTESLLKQLNRRKKRIQELKSTVKEKQLENQTLNKELEKMKVKMNSLEKLNDDLYCDIDATIAELEEVNVIDHSDKDSLTEDIPAIPLRSSRKAVSPRLNIVLAELRNVYKLSLAQSISVFKCVANGFFKQNYRYGNAELQYRRKRQLEPTTNVAVLPVKKNKIDSNTLPSKMFVGEQNKTHHMLALKSIGDKVSFSNTKM